MGRKDYFAIAETTYRVVTADSAAHPAGIAGMLTVLGRFVAPQNITILDSDEHPDTRLMIDSIREFDIIQISMMRVGGRETEAALKKLCPGVPAFDLATQRQQAMVYAGTACPPALEGPQALRSALTELQATQSSGGGR